MRAPLIGVVADRKMTTSGAWTDILTDGLPHTYAAAVEKAGGAPLLIPALGVHRGQLPRLLSTIDGLFLPGGRDVDASLYGQEPHEANDVPLRVRDELEIELVRGALSLDMPIFGACRGLQVLNVAVGGTLEQHLGDRVDQSPHRDIIGVFTNHSVRIEMNSLLYQLVGQAEMNIASHHHQGIDLLGNGLFAVATAEDGIVEAAEVPAKNFCLGVQWHPEEILEPHGLAIMGGFVRAAQAFAGARRSDVMA